MSLLSVRQSVWCESSKRINKLAIVSHLWKEVNFPFTVSNLVNHYEAHRKHTSQAAISQVSAERHYYLLPPVNLQQVLIDVVMRICSFALSQYQWIVWVCAICDHSSAPSGEHAQLGPDLLPFLTMASLGYAIR